jgi:hypothetical protein
MEEVSKYLSMPNILSLHLLPFNQKNQRRVEGLPVPGPVDMCNPTSASLFCGTPLEKTFASTLKSLITRFISMLEKRCIKST